MLKTIRRVLHLLAYEKQRDATYPDHWKEVGITGESGFRKLIYNEDADIQIAQFARVLNPHSLQSLYAKKSHEELYKRLSPYSDTLSYDEPVTSKTTPYAYANVVEWTKKLSGSIGGDYKGVAIFDLNQMQYIQTIGKDKIIIPEGHNEAYVTGLIDALGDNHQVRCVMGLGCEMKKTVEETPNGTSVTYSAPIEHWLGNLSLESGEFHKISHLKHAFV